MAVNALGQMVNLVLAPGQAAAEAVGNLGLVTGQTMQARIIDIFPDQRAVINLKGMNLVAQLPQPQPNQAFHRGQSLDLLVIQAPPKPTSQPSQAPIPQAGQNAQASLQPANAGNGAPVLSLKLIGISAGPALPVNPESGATAAQASPRQTPQPQVIENALSQARLLPNAANIRAAESLLRHGLSLDPASLNQVLRTAESFAGVERAAQLPAQAATPSWPPAIQGRLQEASTLLGLLATQANRAADRPQIQGLLKSLQALQDPSRPLPQAGPAIPQSAVPAEPQILIQRLDSALQSISAAKPGALPSMEALLADLSSARPALQAPPAPGPSQSQPLPPAPLAANPDPSGPALKLPVLREAAVLLFTALRPQLPQGISQQGILGGLAQLDQSALAPQSALLDAVDLAVASQAGQAPGKAETLPLLRNSFAAIQQAFVAKPLQQQVSTLGGLEQAFLERELPSPGIPLSQLPPEDVVDAVVFLKARNLPPSRPLVETVAREISQETNLFEAGKGIADMAKSLPEGLLSLKPGLKEAAQALDRSLARFEINPASQKFWQDLRRAALETGLSLESTLSQLSTEAPAEAGPALPARPEESLKASLLKVRDEARQALAHKVAQASPELTQKLESLIQDAGKAADAINTLQLSARPTPAFEVTHLPLPLALNSQLQGGNLSVFWRKGKPHELDAKDPVNVVFLLNTRALGEVKVQLQVWKEECRCKVVLSDDDARRFVEAGAPELRKAMDENTPFKLSSIDFHSSDGEPLLQEGPASLGSGLSLNA